jgi:hypothetical protein
MTQSHSGIELAPTPVSREWPRELEHLTLLACPIAAASAIAAGQRTTSYAVAFDSGD